MEKKTITFYKGAAGCCSVIRRAKKNLFLTCIGRNLRDVSFPSTSSLMAHAKEMRSNVILRLARALLNLNFAERAPR